MIFDEKGLQITDSSIAYHYGQTEPARLSMYGAYLGWLETKTKKSNSEKTKTAYGKVLGQFEMFLQSNHSSLADDPRKVARLAQDYATRSFDDPGRELSTSTINQRFAILSSYYQYAMKHGACEKIKGEDDQEIIRECNHNPIEYCERPSRHVNHAAPNLDREFIADRLRMIDTTTLEGKRDYALIALAVTTGRRAAELSGLCWSDLQRQGQKLTLTWRRCKGNKTMHNTIGGTSGENALIKRLYAYVGALYGPLEGITSDAPIFVALGRRRTRKDGTIAGLSHQSISNIFEARLGVSQVHSTRHTFAVNMHKSGANIQEIGDQLGHTNYNVTAGYLKERLQAENKHLDKLIEGFGID